MCNDNPVSQCFCKALNDLLSSLWTVPYTFEEPMSDKPNEDFELDLRQISWAHFRVYYIEVVRHLCISILSGKNIYSNMFSPFETFYYKRAKHHESSEMKL